MKYHESSGSSTPADDVDDTFNGYHLLGGAEYKITRWLGVAGEASWTTVPDAIGESGVSDAFNETDLGGATFRVQDHHRAMTPFEREVADGRVAAFRSGGGDLRRRRQARRYARRGRAVGNIMRRRRPTRASLPPGDRRRRRLGGYSSLPLSGALLTAEGLTVTPAGWWFAKLPVERQINTNHFAP